VHQRLGATLSTDIRDKLNSKVKRDVPKDWQPSAQWDGSEGEIVTPATTEQPNFEELLREHGHNPDEIEILGEVRQSRWQRYDGEWLTAYRFRIRRKAASLNLPALFAEARRTKIKPPAAVDGKALVVVWADPQTGKSDSRGGTAELLLRIAEKRANLDAYIKQQKTTSAFFMNAGDSIEGFENTAGQMFTNDLSLIEQLDLEATLEWQVLAQLSKSHGRVVSAVVPSNHAAWRSGKNALGKPSDDWGLFIQKQHAKMAELAGLPIEFARPEDWSESLAIDINGTIVGLAHGHRASNPDAIPKWWAGQVHGGQPLSQADVLITGHYHHLRVQPSGRNPYNGRSKWWLQAPTLDNGSSWWRNASGDDSDPGLLVFVIDDNGFNLQSLTVL
jgi:hypothetical protein